MYKQKKIKSSLKLARKNPQIVDEFLEMTPKDIMETQRIYTAYHINGSINEEDFGSLQTIVEGNKALLTMLVGKKLVEKIQGEEYKTFAKFMNKPGNKRKRPSGPTSTSKRTRRTLYSGIQLRL